MAISVIWAIGHLAIDPRKRAFITAAVVAAIGIFLAIEEVFLLLAWGVGSIFGFANQKTEDRQEEVALKGNEDRDHSPSDAPVQGRTTNPKKREPFPWPVLVLIVVGVTIGFGFAAHEFGIVESNNALTGDPVDFNLLGVHVPSIAADPVTATPAMTSAEITRVTSRRCFLLLGVPGSYTSLYDWTRHQTLYIPSSDLVLTQVRTCNNQKINNGPPPPATTTTTDEPDTPTTDEPDTLPWTH
jgi:hypothetical protein